jgi:hypothetical protein
VLSELHALKELSCTAEALVHQKIWPSYRCSRYFGSNVPKEQTGQRLATGTTTLNSHLHHLQHSPSLVTNPPHQCTRDTQVICKPERLSFQS